MTAGREAKRSTSAARVYLFADFGKGPRVVRLVPAHASLLEVAQNCAIDGPMSSRHRGDARAWWLVECESAEAGRALIAASEKAAALGIDYYDEATPGLPDGCILDSGGAR